MNDTYFLVSTDSTMGVAREYAEQGEAHGTAVFAESQQLGRGRLGKSWISPPGKGLYCTIVARPQLEITEYPKITLVVGIAVAQAIERLAGIVVGLKWPNDIYVNSRKLGGILCESHIRHQIPGLDYALLGIGINLNTTIDEFPADLQTKATSLFLHTGTVWPITQVLAEVRAEVLRELTLFEKNGLPPIIEKWRKRDFLYGKTLRWITVAQECVEGVSLGIDDSGLLHICDNKGIVHEILSGDIQLGNK
jgi:BirA family transcriptional regulator, biotin operon repressor / biotin---[acetyl-CoA-carboxylase] ligase